MGRFCRRLRLAQNLICIKHSKQHLLNSPLEPCCTGVGKGRALWNAPHPQPGLPQWAVLCPSSLHTWPCGQATGHGTVSRLGTGNWGCWSVAQLNLNENRNDSSGLGSMGQRVPWPPRNKRSISGENAGAHCVPAPHRARGSSYFGAEGTNASGESRTWTSTNMSSTLHHQCPPRHNNNGNKNTAAALVGVLSG